MTDFIVFSVGSNRYALDIENIQRIIQAIELTEIPNAHPYVDGMMPHEQSVIKVLSFRKLIGLKTYDEELKELFLKLKSSHQSWVDELSHSLENGVEFTKTTDPTKCELGRWLDSFSSYDDRVSEILKGLVLHHKLLHTLGIDALSAQKEQALEILNTKILKEFKQTMQGLDSFIHIIEVAVNSLQKFILYEKEDFVFAIKVDAIEDIVHIDKSTMMSSDDETKNEFLELDGVLDIDGVLINVIKNVNIPK